MTSLKNIKNKIFSIAELKKEVQKWKKNNDKIETDKNAAIAQGNSSWISKNKQNYINEFNEKLNEYEKVIIDLDTKRNSLIDKFTTYEKQIKEAKKKIKTTFKWIHFKWILPHGKQFNLDTSPF